MQVQRLTLKHFRGFDELELDFSPRARTAVLIGNNGSGKSSVLDAIAMLLSTLMSAKLRKPALELAGHDIKLGKKFCHIGIQVLHEGELHTWHQKIGESDEAELPLPVPGKPENPTVDVENQLGSDPAFARRTSVEEHGYENLKLAPFPVLALYPVERIVRDFKDEEATLPVLQSGPAYENFRSDRSADFITFLQWFLARENIENEEIRRNPSFRDGQLEAVRTTIQKMLPNFSGPSVRRARGRREVSSNVFVKENTVLLLEKDGETLTLEQLSHGEREFLALAGDIARRLAMAFPTLPDPCQGPGVVLIDEVCLHLHPQWQGEIIEKLEAAFPSVQFIVSTHSPQIVSRVKPESVTILDHFQVIPNTPPTWGRDTNSILSDLMGVEYRPDFARKWLHAIARLIDEGDWPAARRALSTLEANYGADDAEIIRLRTMIDVLGGPSEDVDEKHY
jgi:predicted ATP-binding protein involved in virulence